MHKGCAGGGQPCNPRKQAGRSLGGTGAGWPSMVMPWSSRTPKKSLLSSALWAASLSAREVAQLIGSGRLAAPELLPWVYGQQQLPCATVKDKGALTPLCGHVEVWQSPASHRPPPLPTSSPAGSTRWFVSWWGKASPHVPVRLPSQKAASPPQMPVAMAAGFVPAVFFSKTRAIRALLLH